MVYIFKENRVRRSYAGGSQIDKFLDKNNCENTNCPEEWLASTVTAFNPDYEVLENEGLSVCDNGEIFKNIVENLPEKVFGERLAKKYNSKSSILVKLLDSAERLVIQCHPTINFAKEYFNSQFGKTECWYIIDSMPEACVYLGFKEGISKEKWKELFYKQDTEGMLECLHKFPVSSGDLWFVDGGVPHAIGEGCFMIELQEPTDLMVIPEKKTQSGKILSDIKLHCGLGFEKMFDCFCYNGLSYEETKSKYYRKSKFDYNKINSIVDTSLTDKFSMSCVRVFDNFSYDFGDTYAVCIIISGECKLICNDTAPIYLKKGSNFLIGANSGTVKFVGNADIVMCIA